MGLTDSRSAPPTDDPAVQRALESLSDELLSRPNNRFHEVLRNYGAMVYSGRRERTAAAVASRANSAAGAGLNRPGSSAESRGDADADGTGAPQNFHDVEDATGVSDPELTEAEGRFRDFLSLAAASFAEGATGYGDGSAGNPALLLLQSGDAGGEGGAQGTPAATDALVPGAASLSMLQLPEKVRTGARMRDALRACVGSVGKHHTAELRARMDLLLRSHQKLCQQRIARRQELKAAASASSPSKGGSSSSSSSSSRTKASRRGGVSRDALVDRTAATAMLRAKVSQDRLACVGARVFGASIRSVGVALRFLRRGEGGGEFWAKGGFPVSSPPLSAPLSAPPPLPLSSPRLIPYTSRLSRKPNRHASRSRGRARHVRRHLAVRGLGVVAGSPLAVRGL